MITCNSEAKQTLTVVAGGLGFGFLKTAIGDTDAVSSLMEDLTVKFRDTTAVL